MPPPQEHGRDPERRVAQSHPPPEIALKSCIGRHTLNLLGIISSRFPFPFPCHIYFPARAPDLTARPPACLVRSLLGYFWDWITWGLVLCIMCMFPPTTATTTDVRSVICSAGTASALRVLHFFLLDRFRRHSRRLPFCARLLPSVSQRYCRVAIRSSFPLLSLYPPLSGLISSGHLVIWLLLAPGLLDSRFLVYQFTSMYPLPKFRNYILKTPSFVHDRTSYSYKRERIDKESCIR